MKERHRTWQSDTLARKGRYFLESIYSQKCTCTRAHTHNKEKRSSRRGGEEQKENKVKDKRGGGREEVEGRCRKRREKKKEEEKKTNSNKKVCKVKTLLHEIIKFQISTEFGSGLPVIKKAIMVRPSTRNIHEKL